MLGSSVAEIFTLISKEFVRLVLIAFLIASPVAYYAMTKWLQIFAYRINIGVMVFVVAGICSLLVALLSVGYQSIKAGMVNPIKSIRYEWTDPTDGSAFEYNC